MKFPNVFVLISLILVCCTSVAYAQVAIDSIERMVSVQLNDLDVPGQSHTLQETSSEVGLFSHDLELNEGSALITASQHTMTSSAGNQFSISGQMGVGIEQTATEDNQRLESRSSLESYFSTEVLCDFSLSGTTSGPLHVQLEIVDVTSGQDVAFESATDAEFNLVGTIPPGNYFVTVWMWDEVYETGPVDQHTEISYNFTVAQEGTVINREMSLTGVKALYR